MPAARQASRSPAIARSEEHTSELQSHDNLVCRLLLEKKKKYHRYPRPSLSVNSLVALLKLRHGRRARARSLEARGAEPDDDCLSFVFIFFFFNYRAPPEIYPLSLHDALPIMIRRPPRSTLFPYTRSSDLGGRRIIRSEERRVGEEGRSRGSPYHSERSC